MSIPLWTLECADALVGMAGLADASVDAVVTDPPYCAGGFTDQARRAAASMTTSKTWFRGDNLGAAGLTWLLRSVACEAARALVDGGSLLVCADWRMVAHLAPALESAGLAWRNLVVWDKLSVGMGAGFRPRHELVLHFVKGARPKLYRRDVGNVIALPRVPPAKKHHWTEKPAALMRDLVSTVTPEGGLVVDPFAGSASTGVAALELGRRFIGFEVDPAIVAVGRERLLSTTLLGVDITPLEAANDDQAVPAARTRKAAGVRTGRSNRSSPV